jgi:hypothetical protein
MPAMLWCAAQDTEGGRELPHVHRSRPEPPLYPSNLYFWLCSLPCSAAPRAQGVLIKGSTKRCLVCGYLVILSPSPSFIFYDQATAMGSDAQYSVPLESERLFHDGIICHEFHRTRLPKEALEYEKLVRFEGTASPSLAINWRFAESVASLKGLEAVMINILLKKKYGVDPVEVVINTYVCSLSTNFPRSLVTETTRSCFSCLCYLLKSTQNPKTLSKLRRFET